MTGVQTCALPIYEYVVNEILSAAEDKRPLAVSALAVHGIMTGYLDPVHRRRLNGLDLVVPDGQPVRWGLGLTSGIKLPDRVYGPELTLRVMAEAARKHVPVYVYGSTPVTLELFAARLKLLFPDLLIAGQEPSKFRRLSQLEKTELANRIKGSGARIVLLGLGCPRQESWVYEYCRLLNMPLLAVGAAFDFHAGLLRQAPPWIQNSGLEWLYRLVQEPGRLWRRYLLLNPLYVTALFLEALGWRRIPVILPDGQEPEQAYG